MHTVLQPHVDQQLQCMLVLFRLASLVGELHGQHHILDRIQRGDKVEGLKDEANLCFIYSRRDCMLESKRCQLLVASVVTHFVAEEQHGPGGGFVDCADDVQ